MTKKYKNNSFTLIGLDIQGEWNVPLLLNAAEISGGSLVLAQSHLLAGVGVSADKMPTSVKVLKDHYDQVLACETGKKRQSIFHFPAPRGHTALIVGNELTGVPRTVLNEVAQVISVPMHGRGMSSVNVAVAAAVTLYSLERDLARKGIKPCGLKHRNVDLLIQGPTDPSELGSLFRSAWAFGWRKVFLSDHQGIWFTKHREIVLAGRAAARREINPLVVVPEVQLRKKRYDVILHCNGERSGTALSHLTLPPRGSVLIIYGEGEVHLPGTSFVEHVFVDHVNSSKAPRFRHAGSILLSVVSEMLCRDKRG